MYDTPSTIANLLQVSEEQVLAHIRAGRLKAVNVGCGVRRPRWRISAEALNEFLESRAATPHAPRAARRKRMPNTVEFYS